MNAVTIHWQEPIPTENPDEIQNMGLHPLVAQALVRRGITNLKQAQQFFNPDIHQATNAYELTDMDKAVDRLEGAITNQELIGVWGDFDVDGQTATTILVSALRNLGANVNFHIPIRDKESHGIQISALQSFLNTGVRLVLTCDTGISAHDAVAYAQSLGIDVIISDHHTLPDQLPLALAVINPHRLPSSHPLASLCGVGCAFKVIEALYARYGRNDSAQFLDLVAMGTVADLALLNSENRMLVQSGLRVLRANIRPGLKALLTQANVQPEFLSEEHISFILAPRMNALGRLADANAIVEFLLSNDPVLIERISSLLENLNNRRKHLCDQVFQAAISQIQKDHSLLEYPALFLSHPAWPAGVIGIVASRLVELYHLPTILITSPPDQTARASARSIEGVDITAAIAANQSMLLNFGGHPMAAGFSLAREKIADFRRALFHTIEKMTMDTHPSHTLALDGYLTLEEINLELVEQIDKLAPFGPGNPPLIFASRNLTLLSSSAVGKNKEHLQVIVENENGLSHKIIWWQGAGFSLPEGKFDLAYSLRASDYRGQRDIQIEWITTRIPDEKLTITNSDNDIEVLDYRQVKNPNEISEIISNEHSVLIWQEGTNSPLASARDRYHLEPCNSLVIASVPPGRKEIETVLSTTLPIKVYLMGISSGIDQPQNFLKQLAGFIHHSLKFHNGFLDIHELAARTSQRETLVIKGIEWWEAHGDITILKNDTSQIVITLKGSNNNLRLKNIESALKAILEETVAYRSFYLRARPDSIISLPQPPKNRR